MLPTQKHKIRLFQSLKRHWRLAVPFQLCPVPVIYLTDMYFG